MMIQRIGALSNNTSATKFKQQQQYQTAPSFEGFGVNKSANAMKALAAAAILGMASVGMSACKQPTDPTPIEIPEEKPQPPVEEEPIEEEPVVEEPVVEETPEVEEVAPVEKPAKVFTVKDTDNYKMLKAIGAKVEIVDLNIENKEGYDRRMTGDIIGMTIGKESYPFGSFTDFSMSAKDNDEIVWSMDIYGGEGKRGATLFKGFLAPSQIVYLDGYIHKEDDLSTQLYRCDDTALLTKQITFQVANVIDDDVIPIEANPYTAEENPKYSSFPDSVKSSDWFKLLGSWDTNIEVMDITDIAEELGEDNIESGTWLGVKVDNEFMETDTSNGTGVSLCIGGHYFLKLEEYYANMKVGYEGFLNESVDQIRIVTMDKDSELIQVVKQGEKGEKAYWNDQVTFILAYNRNDDKK